MDQATAESTETVAARGTNWWVRLTRAPVILQAYIVFTLFAVSFSMTASFVPPLGRIVVPYTGWTGGINYGFTLFFAVAAALVPQRRMIYAVIALLGLFALFGCLEMIGHLVWLGPASQNFENPYLIYHGLRPAFDIVLPAFWIALLLSPSMRKWINDPATPNAYAPRQFSLVDLLYLMLIVSLGLASMLMLASLVRRVNEYLEPVPAAAPGEVPAAPNPGSQPLNP